MKNNLFLLLMLGLVLVTAQFAAADPNLVGWWKMDDPEADMLWDYSGNDNHGFFMDDANVMADPCGIRGEVLSLNETHVEVGNSTIFDLPKAVSMAAWIHVDQYTKGFQTVIAKGNGTYRLGRDGTTRIGSYINGGTGGYVGLQSTSDVEGKGWVHVAVTCDASVETDNYHIYVNGIKENTKTRSAPLTVTTAPLWIGGNSEKDRDWKGYLDDVRLYNKALTQKEILELAEVYTAQSQSPDGETGLLVDVELSWIAAFSESRTFNIYYGTDANNVRDSQPASLLGDTVVIADHASTTLTETFTPDTTYYWRVDVVDGVTVYADEGIHTFSIAPGNSFNLLPADGTEDIPFDSVILNWSPGSLPVDGYNVYMGTSQVGLTKQNSTLLTEPTFVPSGLAKNITYYWQVEDVATSNVLSPVISFTTSDSIDPNMIGWWRFDEGSGNVALDYSGNGNNGSIVGAQFADGIVDGSLSLVRAEGCYVDIPPAAFDSINNEITFSFWAFGGEALPVNTVLFQGTNADGRVLNCHMPYINSGNNNVHFDGGDGNSYDNIRNEAPLDVLKGQWNHWVFTKDAVAGEMKMYLNGQLWYSEAGKTTLMTPVDKFYIGGRTTDGGVNWDGLLDDFRVYNRELSATQARELYWDVNPPDYTLIDDMESYNDTTNPINSMDGWFVEYGPGGYSFLAKASNSEPVLLDQSLGFSYDNYGSSNNEYYNSECVKTLDSPMDWTEDNLSFLAVNFYGQAFNIPEKFYVALEDNTGVSQAVTHIDPNILLTESWQTWEIPLADFTGVDLTQIKKIYLGCGVRFDQDWLNNDYRKYGTVYIDDVTVNPPACRPDIQKPDADITDDCVVDIMDVQLMANDWLIHDVTIVPVPVDDTNLVGCWNFDSQTADDSSGNGHHGILINDANISYDDERGYVLNLDHATDCYVDCGGGLLDGDWAALTDEMTAMSWVKADSFTTDYQYILSKGNAYRISRQSDSDYLRFYNSGFSPSSLVGSTYIADGQWHHIAATYNGAERILYIDGRIDAYDTETGNMTYNEANLIIGGHENWPERAWQGLIDDVRFYNRALSHGEILTLAGYTENLLIEAETNANIDPVGTPGEEIVNYKDFSVIADTWLEEILWP